MKDAFADDDFIDDVDEFATTAPKTKKHGHNFLEDGVCESCGNTGLAGDRCPCGGAFVNISEGLENYEVEDSEDEPKTYSLEELKDEEEDDPSAAGTDDF